MVNGTNPWTNNEPVHGISFYQYNLKGDLTQYIGHTWNTWHLVPTSRPVIEPPDPKTLYKDVPGANGKLDLSEALNGYRLYENRSGSIEFIVANGWKSWELVYQSILNDLHGRRVFAILDDDPTWYYQGRIALNQWKSDESHSTITFDYDFYPYKRELTSADEDWLWDPFDFEYGVINEFDNISVGDTTENPNGHIITIIGCSEPQPLSINIISVANSDLGLTVHSGSIKYVKQGVGLHRYPDILITNGENQISFDDTSGVISIPYRRGLL